MKFFKQIQIPFFYQIAPLLFILATLSFNTTQSFISYLVLGTSLFASVICSVYYAEVVAHRVGEPFGTLILALAVTIIESALIISVMAQSPETSVTLARDTVYAAIMIIINGMIGLSLLYGASKFQEQTFKSAGVNASLATLAAISILTLVLPNFTSSASGPYYSHSQMVFISIVTLFLYGTFLIVQTIRHRDYFLPDQQCDNEETHADPHNNITFFLSLIYLSVCLILVVKLAKTLAPPVENLVVSLGAPKAFVGVLIAVVVLLPEGYAALRAAQKDRLQTSMNLSLGSALSSIGLTIPVVALYSLFNGNSLVLGLDSKSTVLLILSFMVATLSLGTGRTTIMQGAIHLVIFCVYIFINLVP